MHFEEGGVPKIYGGMRVIAIEFYSMDISDVDVL